MKIGDWWRSNVPDDSAGRRLVIASLIDNLGSGLRESITPLFLVLVAGLPATDVGLGLLLSGIIGVAAAPIAGRMADRMGPKRALIFGCVVRALATAGFIFIHSLWILCVVMAVARAASQFSRIGRFTLVANVSGERRNTLRAQMNVFSNAGIAAGVGLSAIILTFGTSEAYLTGFIFSGVMFVVTGAFQLTIDDAAFRPVPVVGAPPPATVAPWRGALRDHRYALVVGLNGVLYFHQEVLTLGIPLWIASKGEVPTAIAPASFLLNLLIVIAFQVRFSAPVRGINSAARSWRRSAVGIAAACALVLLAGELDSPTARILAVIGGVALLSLGELWYSAAEMEVSTGLAPVDQRGLYQGIFVLGRDLAHTVGTLVAAILCVSAGPWGWLILIGSYGLFSVVGPPVLRWAGRYAQEQTSEQFGSATHQAAPR